MTAKRFRKLLYSEMAKAVKGNAGAGDALRRCLTATPHQFHYTSYQETWNVIRFAFIGLSHNIGKNVPER